jgi:hypothetical protein
MYKSISFFLISLSPPFPFSFLFLFFSFLLFNFKYSHRYRAKRLVHFAPEITHDIIITLFVTCNDHHARFIPAAIRTPLCHCRDTGLMSCRHGPCKSYQSRICVNISVFSHKRYCSACFWAESFSFNPPLSKRVPNPCALTRFISYQLLYFNTSNLHASWLPFFPLSRHIASEVRCCSGRDLQPHAFQVGH